MQAWCKIISARLRERIEEIDNHEKKKGERKRDRIYRKGPRECYEVRMDGGSTARDADAA